MTRTRGDIYVDIQDVEGEILLASFHGYPATVFEARLRELQSEMAAAEADNASRIAAQLEGMV